jgi:O-antigen/teichoic acid export membrane protein
MRRLVFITILLVMVLAAPAQAAASGAVRVYYAGPTDGDESVYQALQLAKNFEIVADLTQADVLVLNGAAPDATALRARLQQGAGLVLILGPDLTADQVGTLLGGPVTLELKATALSLNAVTRVKSSVLQEIVWTSAPQIRERFVLRGAAATPLVAGFEDQSLILGAQPSEAGQVFVFTPFLGEKNRQLQDWAYFNYFIYHLVERGAGQTPDSFADYAGSPVPHAQQQIVLVAFLGGLLATAVVAFYFVRRYSLAHPEALDAVVSDRASYETHEASSDWEDIGFHRPLGGFFLALFLGLVLFVPLIIYQNLILPVYILPSAQALGIWGRVTQFFTLVWTFFDMGTSAAFIKFMAQYRVDDPRRGVKFGQVFVWWQALSGTVQVAVMVGLAGTVLPHTAYAIYAWSIVIHTVIQIPGFYQVMRHALTGMQRFDYSQILDLALTLIFPMLTQPILVSLMVVWGRSQPAIGASMGGLLGLGLAAYAAEALTFALGLWLYRRLGYNARLYFLAHFDWSVIKDSFRFGIFEMLGSAVWGVGQSLEILITQAYLVNYAEVWGNWVVAQNFVYGFNVINTLYNDLMPSISEAVSHGRRVLGQYYSAMAYKWGGLISVMLGAVLLAVADRFILGASGPDFVRAAAYSVPLLIWGVVQYPSWVGDNVQRGANKPGLMVLMVGMEQILRIGLALLLLPMLQINALIVAYFVGILTKNVVAYFVNDRLCFKQKFYPWQSLVAPILAGVAHYAVVRWVGGFIWQGPGDTVSSVILMFVAILPSYPLFAFFYALFGGWDDATLAEVRRAAGLCTFMRPLAWLFWAASDLGARISPLHGRFPIRIYADALAEANSLKQERIEL